MESWRNEQWKLAAAEPKITVIVRGGRKHSYSGKDIQKMLDNKSMYQDADNLPKWIWIAANMDKVRAFPKRWSQIWKLLETMLTSKNVEINVQSDKRGANRIKMSRDFDVRLASQSFDIIDDDSGEILGEAVPEKIFRAWIKQNAKNLKVKKESAPSGNNAGVAHIKTTGKVSDVPVSRGGGQHQRGQKPGDQLSPEDLKEKIQDRLSYRAIQKWWKKQDQYLDVEEEDVRKRQNALEKAFDWQSHASDFVSDFKSDLKGGVDPSWFMTDMARALKDGDSEGALKQMSVSGVAENLYDAVLKEMKRQKIASSVMSGE